MTATEHSIFVRVKDGPRGERRYREVGRTDDVHEARRAKDMLEKAGRKVIVQSDRRPPGSS